MTDLVRLDSKIRSWLKRASLPAIVILLKAVHDELKSRTRAHSSLVVRLRSHNLRMADSLLPGPGRPAALAHPVRAIVTRTTGGRSQQARALNQERGEFDDP